MRQEILLGFEAKTGKPVRMKMHHTVVLGMTQLSGKTTTLEALITRSHIRALAFTTKRGERGFHSVHQVQPYYRPRSDWQFVEGLIGAALGGEKIKYEFGMRWAIQKLCNGTSDLFQVDQKAKDVVRTKSLDGRPIKEMLISIFEKLVAYFDLILPELRRHQLSRTLELGSGINVMDLSQMKIETQQIIIASSIQRVYEDYDDVAVVIPEAWEMLPQGRGTPVKLVAEELVRKGAVRGDWLFIDSQDIGVIKQLLGKKIPAEEIQTLELGHFYASIGNDVRKLYVLPNGVPEEVGIQVAKGLMKPEEVAEKYLSTNAKPETREAIIAKDFSPMEQIIVNLSTWKEDTKQRLEQIENNIAGGYETAARITERLTKLEERPPEMYGEKPVRVELNAPATKLVINEPTTVLNLGESDIKTRIVLVMVKASEGPGRPPLWTAMKMLDAFKAREWGSDVDTIARSFRELAGLGVVSITQAGKRTDYSLNKERIEFHQSKLVVER